MKGKANCFSFIPRLRQCGMLTAGLPLANLKREEPWESAEKQIWLINQPLMQDEAIIS
jgi:hypothetical protein